MPTSLMKSFKEEFGVMIVNVANCSFSTARFPQSMKTGLLTSLLKKPGLDTTDFTNFRPITNLTNRKTGPSQTSNAPVIFTELLLTSIRIFQWSVYGECFGEDHG